MVDTVKSWKKDARGHFLVMAVGANKRFSINWDQYVTILDDAVASVVWDIGVGLVKVSEVIVGNVAQVQLSAPVAGEYVCTHTMTTVDGEIEIEKFRVVVT